LFAWEHIRPKNTKKEKRREEDDNPPYISKVNMNTHSFVERNKVPENLREPRSENPRRVRGINAI
jgi:hypothetical protein